MFEIILLRAQKIKCAKYFFGFVITVSNPKDLTNIRCQNLTAFICSTHTVQCKSAYKQILVGDNYKSLKNIFSLCVGMNFPVDCRGKHNF